VALDATFLMPTDLWDQVSIPGPYARAMKQVEHLQARGKALGGVSWIRWADSHLARLPRQERRQGMEVRRFVAAPPKRGLVARGRFFLDLNRRAAHLAREVDADHWVVHDPEVLRGGIAAARGRPLFYDSHEHYPAMAAQNNAMEARLMDWVERRAARSITHCFTVSEGIAARFRAMGVATTVTYNSKPWAKVAPWLAPRDQARRALGVGPDDFLVGFQGSLAGEEGFDLLLPALAKAPPHVRLLAFGGPPSEAQRWQREADALGLGERATIRAPVPMDELYRTLSACDAGALLLPDKGLNWQYRAPNKLFDYLALGLPIVTTPLQEPKAIVQGAGAGVVVERNPTAVAEAFAALAKDPEGCARMGARGRRAFREQYCWERMEDRMRAAHPFWA
jgi:glycosyltransferase involved in cell wall biosynthesis